MNGEHMGKDLKETTMSYFGILFRHLPEVTDKHPRKTCQDSQQHHRDSKNISPPTENKRKALPLYDLAPGVLV
jgi:hypothetical protein